MFYGETGYMEAKAVFEAQGEAGIMAQLARFTHHTHSDVDCLTNKLHTKAEREYISGAAQYLGFNGRGTTHALHPYINSRQWQCEECMTELKSRLAENAQPGQCRDCGSFDTFVNPDCLPHSCYFCKGTNVKPKYWR